MIYNYEDIKDKKREIIDKINAEYKFIRISTLGGIERACIMLSLSLDKKEDWAYGIFENSRYYHISIDRNGTVENFCNSKVKRIRKKTVKSLDEAIEYINKKIREVVNESFKWKNR